MYLTIEDERIDDIKFITDGCGATIACASYIARGGKRENHRRGTLNETGRS